MSFLKPYFKKLLACFQAGHPNRVINVGDRRDELALISNVRRTRKQSVFFWLGWLAFLACAVGLLWWWIYVSENGIPTPEDMFSFSPPTTGAISSADGVPLGYFAREYRIIVPYEQIPEKVRYAILSAEDKEFFAWWHWGINYPRLLAAGIENIRSQRIVSGASSPTQQVVKVRFMGNPLVQENKTKAGIWEKFERKVLEIRITLRWEWELYRHFGWNHRKAKEEIFRQYVSLMYLGRYPSGGGTQYGFAAAADFYFGKFLSELDYHEAALLAALIQHPINYSPLKNPILAKTARDHILKRMYANGYLNQKQCTEYLEKPVFLRQDSWNRRDLAPAALGYLFSRLTKEDEEDLYAGAVGFRTTLNTATQHIVKTALLHGLAEYRERHADQPEKQQKITATAVVLKNNGDIVAVAEAGDVGDWRGFAWFWQAWRQLGSVMKIVDYLDALRNGWDIQPNSEGRPYMVQDGRVSVKMGGGKPRKLIHNYDGKFKGWIEFGQAFAESRNAATMWLVLNHTGIDSVLDTAKSIGLEGRFEHYPTTALGSGEVIPLDLALAFATIANGGCLVDEPRIIERMQYKDGSPDKYYPPKNLEIDCNRIILNEVEDKMIALLRGPLLWRHGTAYWTLGEGAPIMRTGDKPIGLPVLLKTGTTNDFRTALVVMATYGPDGCTVLVLMGFADNTPIGDDDHGKEDMHKEPGGRGPGRIAGEIMRQIYKDRQPPQIPEVSELLIREAVSRWVLKEKSK